MYFTGISELLNERQKYGYSDFCSVIADFRNRHVWIEQGSPYQKENEYVKIVFQDYGGFDLLTSSTLQAELERMAKELGYNE